MRREGVIVRALPMMMLPQRVTYSLTTAVFASMGLVGCQPDEDAEAPAAGDCTAQLLPGDVVITEVMANPAGADEGNEWIELYNARGEALDLAGVMLVTSKTDGSSEKFHELGTLELQPQSYVALGDVLDDEEVRPAWIAYGYGRELGALTNQGGRFALYCGETLVDEVLISAPTENSSRAYDGSRTPDASGNDDLAAWCDARSSFTEGSQGTPGAANDACVEQTPTSCTEDGSSRELVLPQPGDLVITEYHPNPAAVGDTDGEFFELFVTRDVDLNGLSVGTGEKQTVLNEERCLRVAAGSYVVFARQADPERNGGLGPDFTFTFSLTNSNGKLVVVSGEQILDEVSYAASFDGVASSLDPSFLDPDSNDIEGAFCRATQPYGAGDLGSPGGENPPCESTPLPGQCQDGDELRPPRTPEPGDLVITELMPNPNAAPDADGEWFEVLVNRDVDLNGLELGVEDVDQTLDAATCLAVTEGQRLVFARKAAPESNGGLPQVDQLFKFALRNSSGRLFLGYGGEVLDDVTWPASPTGAALAVDPEASDAASNDDPDAWCPATAAYGAGDLGTPGAENQSCGGGNTVDGTCTGGAQTRAIVAPEPGDLVITEFMADPAAVTDAQGEWFEVLVRANVDLNGLQLGRDPGAVEHTLPSGGACLEATAGQRLVFARTSDLALNGGLDDVFASFPFSLNNSDRGIFIGLGDALLDAVTYTSTSAGVARALDPALETPAGNDAPESFCNATAPYGAGDLGTPGAGNPSCG